LPDDSGSGLNWAALLPVALGGVLLVVAWEGTHRKLWSALTGQPQTASSTSSAPFNPFDQNIINTPVVPPTNNQIDLRVCRDNPTAPACLQATASQAALDAGINPTYFLRQIQAESGFNPNAQSPAGAQGIAQFRPATAKGMGVNPFDPIAALKAAANLMGAYIQKYGGGIQGEEKALAAYNWGSGNLQSDIAAHGSSWLQYAPSETQNYINTIVGSAANPPHVS
jgi:hypothetical protein